MKSRPFIFGFLIISCIPLFSAEKTRVAIRFALVEPEYRRSFSDEEIGKLEKEVRAFVIHDFNDRMPFMDFGETAESGHILTFQLIRADGSSGDLLSEVIFRIELQSQGVQPPDPEIWPFRSLAEINKKIGAYDAFLEEILQKLGLADLTGLLKNHLSKIPVSRTGFLLAAPSFEDEALSEWKIIIPFKQEEVCMDLGSRLQVQLGIPTDIGLRKKNYTAAVAFPFAPSSQTDLEVWRNCILSDINHEPSDVLLRFKVEEIRIVGIFITDYLFDASTCQITTPGESGF